MVVKRWLGLLVLVFVFGHGLGATAWAQLQDAAAQGDTPDATEADESEADEPQRLQPGAVAIPTSDRDATPKFDFEYFVGDWKFESNLSESPISSGEPITGRETVRSVLNGRMWEVTIRGDAADSPVVGNGVLIYEDGFFGQFYTRYEVTSGIALLMTGTVGCDLGRTCAMYFETPLFEHGGSTVQLKGQYLLSSPFAYRLRTEISVDQGPFRNLGSVWYRKDVKPGGSTNY